MRMDRSRLISGADLTNTLEIGRTIKKKVLAFNITPMEISTRVVGIKINATDKALIGSQMPKISFGGNILAIGRTAPNKAEELCFIKPGIDMMECGWIIFLTEKGG